MGYRVAKKDCALRGEDGEKRKKSEEFDGEILILLYKHFLTTMVR